MVDKSGKNQWIPIHRNLGFHALNAPPNGIIFRIIPLSPQKKEAAHDFETASFFKCY